MDPGSRVKGHNTEVGSGSKGHAPIKKNLQLGLVSMMSVFKIERLVQNQLDNQCNYATYSTKPSKPQITKQQRTDDKPRLRAFSDLIKADFQRQHRLTK
jgi:hypothetical protein